MIVKSNWYNVLGFGTAICVTTTFAAAALPALDEYTGISSSSLSGAVTSVGGGIVTKIIGGEDILQTIVVPLNAGDRTRIHSVGNALDAIFQELGMRVPNELLPIMAEYESPLRVCVLSRNMVSAIDLATRSRVDISLAAAASSATLAGTNLYLPNYHLNTVSVINTASNTRGADIIVGYGSISVTLVGVHLYVLNSRSNSVSVINTTTNTKVGVDISVGDGPISAAFVGRYLYVFSDTVSVIDTMTNTKIGSDINVGDRPIFATLVGTNLYVVNRNSRNISVIDTINNTKVDADIPVGYSPRSATLAGKHLYVLSDTLSVIDTITNTKTGADIQVGYGTQSAILVGRHLYVLSNAVSVIDTTTNTKVADIPVGVRPISATILGDNLLVTCSDGLYLMDLDKLETQLRTVMSVVASSASSS